MSDLLLRRKWTLRAHGAQVVFVKRPVESAEHVLMKALIWALYLPTYPDLRVETPIGERYKPDVVALDPAQGPRFWGEAGHVGAAKLATLLRRFPHTHFAFAKWQQRLEPLIELFAPHVAHRRTAPVDILAIPADAARFVAEDGTVSVTHADLTWHRFAPEM